MLVWFGAPRGVLAALRCGHAHTPQQCSSSLSAAPACISYSCSCSHSAKILNSHPATRLLCPSFAAAMGASTSVFVEGELGLGWKKTVYGDQKRAMYTYDSSVVEFSDNSAALCGGECREGVAGDSCVADVGGCRSDTYVQCG